MTSISMVRRLTAVFVLVCLVIGLTAGGVPAQAQQATSAPAEGVSTQQLEDLVSTLEDDQKRTEFLDTLKTALASRQAEQERPKVVPSGVAAQLLHGLSNALGSFSNEFAKLGRVFDEAPRLWQTVVAALDAPADRRATVRGILELAVVVLAGLAAWAMALRVLARPRRRLEDKGAAGRVWERAAILMLRLLMDLLPPVLLAVAAWGTLAAVQAQGDVRAVATVAITAIAALKIVTAMSRALFAPHAPRLRVLPITDETAAYLSIWVRRLSLLLIVGFFAIQALALLGLRPPTQVALTKLLGLIGTGFAVVFILQNRQTVTAALRAGTRRSAEAQPNGRKRASHRMVDRFADVWHVLAVFYVVALYGVWAAEVDGGFLFMLRASLWSLLIIGAALVLAHLMQLAMERLFALGSEYRQQFPHLEPRVNRYLPVMHSVLRGLLFVVAVLAVLQAWGLDTLVWLTAGIGQRIAGAVVTIAVVLALALVVWELTSSWIERYLSTTDADGSVIERSARAKTLLPLLRNVLLVALIVVVGLIILSEIGVNIAPLLAGAGVIGLAVGFGSQKLVQDVITGAFMLFEDTLAVGDVVEVGGKSGVVEGLSIRTIRLRDLQGSVHTIPFSAVDKVTNMTKDFSYYLLEIGVAYREDTDEVTQICVDILEEMRHEEYYAPLILEPLEVLGVDKFADSAVVIKARIKTLPIKQWEVGRAFNRRMKKAFDARGIEIPFPHQTLYFGVDKQGKAPPAHVVMDASAPAPSATPPSPSLPPVREAAADLPDPDEGGDR